MPHLPALPGRLGTRHQLRLVDLCTLGESGKTSVRDLNSSTRAMERGTVVSDDRRRSGRAVPLGHNFFFLEGEVRVRVGLVHSVFNELLYLSPPFSYFSLTSL